MTDTLMLREHWLSCAVDQLKPLFEEHGYTVPQVRVTCGWPSQNARPSKRQRIGECWAGAVADDKVPQIFISPMLDSPLGSQGVLATLAHELIHAIFPDAGHKGAFVKCMKALGLEGKPTSTVAGEALGKRIADIAALLPNYPHSALRLQEKLRKQSTRLIKAECPCGCIIRITRQWINEALEGQNGFGVLWCPVCKEGGMEVAA